MTGRGQPGAAARGMCAAVIVFACCSASFAWDSDGSKAQRRAAAAIQQFQEKMPKTERYFQEAYGYAIFHRVGRVGFGFGGGYGRGFVVERDELIGRTKFWQFTSGIQAGVRIFSQIVFFKDKEALEQFKRGRLEFVGQTSISFGPFGAGKDPAYDKGVAVFSTTRFGLMGEATISGVKMTFKPIALTAGDN